MDVIKVSAPGKLFLSGEWAILEYGNPGIVAAVDKRVHAELEPLSGKYISVRIDEFNIRDLRFTWDGEKLNIFKMYQVEVDEEKIRFLKKAVETALKFLKEKGIGFRAFRIRTWGEMSQAEVDGKMKKIGFGSSAASTVVVVKGVLDIHGYSASREEVYKLASIVHYLVQGKVGSGFDVAASVYGGIFVYKRFDGEWLSRKLQEGNSLAALAAQDWPRFEVEPLEIPQGLNLDIAWTKEAASTPLLISKVNEWARIYRADQKRLYREIGNLVRELILAWKAKDRGKILELLRKNEAHLQELGQKAGVEIETEPLRSLSEIANSCGGAGKLSGAGGGDCGIGLSFDKETSERIRRAWKEAGLAVIDAGIDPQGLRSEMVAQ